MTLRTALLRVADCVRALTGPEHLDQRPHQLTIVTRTWSGGAKDVGSATDTLLVLPAYFRVRQLSTREVAGSGGRYEVGDLRVEGVPPAYVDSCDGQTKGYAPSVLDPVVSKNGIEILYRLTGPHAGEYQLVECETWRTYSYHLMLRRRSTSP